MSFNDKKPKLLIIGAAKCGTSTISDLLVNSGLSHGLHKEPNILNMQTEDVINAYNKHYKSTKSDTLLFDASTSYTKKPYYNAAAKNAKYILGDELKIIYCFRDPLKRAISHVKYDMWRKWPRGARDLSNLKYTYFSKYYYQISEWLKYYDSNNFFYINIDEFNRDHKIIIEKLSKFIGHQIVYKKLESNSSKSQININIIKWGKFFGLLNLYRLLPVTTRLMVRNFLPKSKQYSYNPTEEEISKFKMSIKNDYSNFLKITKR